MYTSVEPRKIRHCDSQLRWISHPVQTHPDNGHSHADLRPIQTLYAAVQTLDTAKRTLDRPIQTLDRPIQTLAWTSVLLHLPLVSGQRWKTLNIIIILFIKETIYYFKTSLRFFY